MLRVACTLGVSPIRKGAFGAQQPFSTYVPTSQTHDLATPKSPPQFVSASEAASGLHTSYQGTDAPASLLGSVFSVRLQFRRRTQGVRFKGGGDRPPPLAASFFPDSFFAAEERIGPPEGAN